MGLPLILRTATPIFAEKPHRTSILLNFRRNLS